MDPHELAHQRDRHWIGSHAVARDAAGGVGGDEEGNMKAPGMSPVPPTLDPAESTGLDRID
jgi:hypothetical protein